MESNCTLQVLYSGGITLTISNKTLRQAVEIFMHGEPFKDYGPEKVVVKNKNLTLYFDRQTFSAFLKDEISETKLFKELDATFYYRNNADFLTDDGQTIDAASLWKRTGQTLYLVDEDNYVECNWNSKLFDKL